jgi:hypothetical protein
MLKKRAILRLGLAAVFLEACGFASRIPTVAPLPSIQPGSPPATNPPAVNPVPPTNTPSVPSSSESVPAEYQSLYSALDGSLTAFDQTFHPTNRNAPVTFAAELLPANGNRGTALLSPQAMTGVQKTLDSMQKLGVQGVTVGIKYPLLLPDFPNSAGYLEFFKNVAGAVHQHHMKLDVEMGAVFPAPISSLGVSYNGLTMDAFESRVQEMAGTIIQQVQPDYLDLDAEPDTEASLTRLHELDTPSGFTDFVNHVLDGLDRGSTLVGAGSGSWSGLDFVRSEAANTSLDFISIHVYPVLGDDLANVVGMADIAHQNHKRVILDEMWLYKADTPLPLAGINGELDMERFNTYGFWAPLDQKFLATIAGIARAEDIEYVSAFWSTAFYTYLDYSPDLDTTPYSQVMAQWNTQATPNLLAGQYSATGEFYQQLVNSGP